MCEVRSAIAHSRNKSLRGSHTTLRCTLANQYSNEIDGVDIELPNFRKVTREYGDRGRRSNNDSNTRRHQFVARHRRARGKAKHRLPVALFRMDESCCAETETKPTEPSVEDFALFGL